MRQISIARSEYDELVREYGANKFEELNIKYTDDLKLFKPEGCDSCSKTGYAGRMGIHELLIGTDPMKKLVQLAKPMEEIRAQAEKDGMRSLLQDGISKVFQGHTDLLQVRKVCIK